MKKTVLTLIVIAVAGSGVWYWLASRPPSTTANENAAAVNPVATVKVAPLRRQEIARTIEVFGIVAPAPEGEQVITAPYDCMIRTARVAIGAPVAAGDVLLEISPSPEAKLDFDSANQALKLARATLAATQERFDLQLTTEQDLAAARQAALEAQLKIDSLSARGLGSDGTIKASSAGIVSEFASSPGMLVPTGTPLVKIVHGSRLEARLAVDVTDVGLVHPDQPVTLRSAGRRDGVAVRSTVRTAGGVIDATSGAAEVRVVVPPDAPLLTGEHVAAAIEVERKQALVAPHSAVLPDGDHSVVFVVKDGHAVRHEVAVGISSGDFVDVTGDGLAAGDPVVTLGNYELEDGMTVNVAEPAATPTAEATP